MAIAYQYPNEPEKLIELGDDYRITPTNFLYQPVGIRYPNIEPNDQYYWAGTGLLLQPSLIISPSFYRVDYPNGDYTLNYTWRYAGQGYRLAHSSAAPLSSQFINWDSGLQQYHACQALVYGGSNQWQYPIVGEPDYSQFNKPSTFLRTYRSSLKQKREVYSEGELTLVETLPFTTLLAPGYWHLVQTERTFYKFEVFNNKEVIFTRTDKEQPEVTFVALCPTNTCGVNCGTHICCYGSDGIAVFSCLK